MSAADPNPVLVDLAAWREDEVLLAAAEDCVQATQEAWEASARPPADAEAAARAAARVHPDALEALLAEGRDVHGIATDAGISDVVTFNAHHVRDAVHDEAVALARQRLDAVVRERLARHFAPSPVDVLDSGHFLYPPGTSMGWHTNSGAPGWRLYVTRTDSPGSSFFRYRDPRDGRIVTTTDDTWNFRLFRITADEPLWHAIASQTNRFSFGYLVLDGARVARLRRRLARLLRR